MQAGALQGQTNSTFSIAGQLHKDLILIIASWTEIGLDRVVKFLCCVIQNGF
jgi:hypothetical protein